MHAQIRRELTSNIAVVDWLQAVCQESCPPTLLEGMQQVLSTAGRNEEASRRCLREHQDFIHSCRLSPEQVVDILKHSVRRAIQHAELPADAGTGVLQPVSQEEPAQAMPRYISIVLDDGKAFADAVLAKLPPGTVRPHDGREEFHVTLWHSQAHGALPTQLLALQGAQVRVQAKSVAANAICVCVAVEIEQPHGGLCMNAVPHVTLWTAEGTPNKYSNELLSQMPHIATRPGSQVTLPDNADAYFASLLDARGYSTLQPFTGKIVLRM